MFGIMLNNHSNMANDTLARQREGFLNFSGIYNFLLGPTENQVRKLFKKNMVILMQNQTLQQSLIERNAHAINITWIHLAKNSHTINRLVDGLKEYKWYCLP